MSKIYDLKELGFKITWNLIAIDLYGDDEIPPLITYLDVEDYLVSLLTNINEQTENIIALICKKEDRTKFDQLLKELANEDDSNIRVQKRKWRAY